MCGRKLTSTLHLNYDQFTIGRNLVVILRLILLVVKRKVINNQFTTTIKRSRKLVVNMRLSYIESIPSI